MKTASALAPAPSFQFITASTPAPAPKVCSRTAPAPAPAPKENLVWRIVHRTEFENRIDLNEVRKGQFLRVQSSIRITDITGFVSYIDDNILLIEELTGYKRGEQVKVKLNSISSIDEILSSPLFYRFRKMVDNIRWKAVTQGTAGKS